ncbi:hypothetical protein [Streptomyces sp. CBMA123]|uniref:hypothetical protein n=1 Tax=Streptomyces sp. CBMA123 TaxID=1896313 RepID=UPI001661A8C2|nr:hypothetical protein [Streptomyces sp. CBMA123]MBD0688860.1 hypothetical protein [Streptomyces sp. CBMA123]
MLHVGHRALGAQSVEVRAVQDVQGLADGAVGAGPAGGFGQDVCGLGVPVLGGDVAGLPPRPVRQRRGPADRSAALLELLDARVVGPGEADQAVPDGFLPSVEGEEDAAFEPMLRLPTE